MPAWNLSMDLVDLLGAHCFAHPACYPFDDAPSNAVDVESLRIVQGDDSRKILSIQLTIENSEVYAMVAGRVFIDGVNVRLETEFFEAMTIRALDLSATHAAWFRQWLESPAGTIPAAIVYHDVSTTLSFGEAVDAGAAIGRVTAGSRLGVSVEYSPSSGGAVKCAHPREFFSLLFWRAAHDPMFNLAPTSPSHPILREMHERRTDGSEVLDGYEHADWLGLRPPLRTYKRVEWEARQTHWLHHENWQISGNVSAVLQNPLIRTSRGAPLSFTGASKCNVITGELLFRSGFRCHSFLAGTDRLGYANGGVFWSRERGCTSAESDCNGRDLKISDGRELTWEALALRRELPFGRKKFVEDAAALNDEIATRGKVYVYSRWQYGLKWPCVTETAETPDRISVSPGGRCSGPAVAEGIDRCGDGILTTANDSNTYEYKVFHMFVISHVSSIASNRLAGGSTGLDQHCTLTAPAAADFAHEVGGDGWSGAVDATQRVFVELIPGGDPSEPWGVADLNCLRIL